MKHTLLALSVAFAFGAANAATSPLVNGSFETSNVSAGGYLYAGAVVASPWSFANGSGIGTNGSAWGGTAFDGSSYGFLQGANSVISQTFSGLAGPYTINFSLAQRTLQDIGFQQVKVNFDGQWLSNQTNHAILPSTMGYTPGTDVLEFGGWTSYSFTVNASSAGSHTLSFAGLGYQNMDTTVFVDGISVSAPTVTPVPEPATFAMLLAGLGMLGSIAVRRKSQRA